MNINHPALYPKSDGSQKFDIQSDGSVKVKTSYGGQDFEVSFLKKCENDNEGKCHFCCNNKYSWLLGFALICDKCQQDYIAKLKKLYIVELKK